MKRKHADDLRGASRLAVEATEGVMALVEAMHNRIAQGPDVLGRPLERPVKLINDLVYGSIRGVTKLVGGGIDLALAQLAPLLGESTPGPEREAVLAAINGVLGDYLVESKNPLAIEMSFRKDGHPLELSTSRLAERYPDAGGKIVLLLHGSSMNDLQWTRLGHHHGESLARDFGYTPIALHYNSGLHISDNGAELSPKLDELVAAWPVPVSGIVLLGHSMGGLVARSACHVAEEAGHAWRAKLEKLVCLGSPHHGAPLERGGNWIDLVLGVSSYSAPLARLGKIRSAGVTDLRFGNVLPEHWEGRDRFEHGADPRRELRLPEGVDCYAVAATLSPNDASTIVGDGLVPVASALGEHTEAALSLAFPESQKLVVFGTGHLDLLSSAKVYEALARWLAPR